MVFFSRSVKPQKFDKCSIQLLITCIILAFTVSEPSQDPLEQGKEVRHFMQKEKKCIN